MKSIDEFAIAKLGVPSLQLMENAGRSVVEEITKRIGVVRRTSVLIVCGKGNNGGDGFVVARIAARDGANVTVIMMEKKSGLQGDALVNFGKLSNDVNVVSFSKFLKEQKENYDVIVDAMFGTSFYGSLRGKYGFAARWINRQKNSLVVAVDIPSGLQGETGSVEGEAVKADITVTFSNPKIGFYLQGAKECTGEVVVKEIGIPEKAMKALSKNIFLVEEADARELIPHRQSNSHKHSVGKIFVLAGSRGMTGAALLCSQSAMKSGAGQVILGIPDSEYSIVAKRTLEVMALGLPSTQEGSVALTAKKEIQQRINWADVLLIGCGLSQNNETQQLIREIVRETSKPLVIDADGLNALSGHLAILKNRKSKHIVLTPHTGEFSRLTGISSGEIEKNKFQLARRFAEQYNLTLVLKGAPTITATPSGSIFVNSTGNPGMSTAGSGDVLAGIIASLIGQKLSAEAAAVCGVYLHGLAGDVAAENIGMHGMLAGDIIKYLPHTLKTLTR